MTLDTLQLIAALMVDDTTVAPTDDAGVFALRIYDMRWRGTAPALVAHLLERFRVDEAVARKDLERAQAYGEASAVEAARAAHDAALRNLNEARALAAEAST